MVAKHKVGIHQNICSQLFGKWEEGCKCVRNPCCEWALYFAKIAHHEANPIHTQGRSHGRLTQLRLIPKSKGGEGEGVLCTHSIVCAWYI
jgi:hypothetical protein